MKADTASSIATAKTARLVALLRGEGLTATTVRELLRPESAAKLKAILTDRVFCDRDGQPDKPQPQDGKLLVFETKKTLSQ